MHATDELLEAMRNEAEKAIQSDDFDTGISILNRVVELSFPRLVEHVRETPELVEFIRFQSLDTESTEGKAACHLLKLLKEEGLAT